VVRNLDSHPTRSLNAVEPLVLAAFDFFSVNDYDWHLIYPKSVSRELHQGRHGLGFHVAGGVGAFDVVFEFAAEFADGVFDWPGGSVGQPADGRAGDDAD